MPIRRTTIEFTETIEPLLKDLEIGGFDLKNICNGGVMALSRLTGDGQKNRMLCWVDRMVTDEPDK